MLIGTSKLSKKYAQAFLNVFFDQITSDCIVKLERVEDFLKKNRFFFIYLKVPSISIDKKREVLNKFINFFALCAPVKKLTFLLLEQGRIDFLDDIIEKIIKLYRVRKDIQFFRIYVSHSLSEQEKERIIRFVKSLASKDVISKFIIDPKLITGIRIQSDSFLWERSVSKQLREVKRSIFKQVGLW
jgi:F-type H+-transporting ATPase subunit delta